MRSLQIVTLILILHLLAAPLTAQNRRSTAALPPLTPMFAARIATIENELATLLQTPLDAAGARPMQVELQIDLRLLTRWMAQQAIAAKPETPLQITTFLRARNLFELIPRIDEFAQAQPQLSPAQLEAILALHRLTFKLPEIGEVKQLDTFCRDIANHLATALGPAAAGANTAQPMRPRPIPAHGAPRNAPGDPPNTPAQWAATARSLAVSIPLRRQLLVLADRAVRLAATNDQPEETRTIESLLIDSVTLAQGLQNNTGVSPETRNQIETRLAEGISLSMDVRTRSIGKTRLDELEQYRLTVARVAKMQLPPEMRERLAPAIIWANQNPREGTRVLAAIEKMMEQIDRFQSRVQPAPLPGNHQKAVTELERQFRRQVGGFVEIAETLDQGGMMASNPSDLPGFIDQMRATLDLLEIIPTIPGAQDTLLSHRPRPTGGLERKIAQALTAAPSEETSNEKTAAIQYLKNVVTLARASQNLSQRTTVKPPVEIERSYAHGQLGAFADRWRVMVGEMATTLSGEGGINQAALNRFAVAAQLVDSLATAEELETALSKLGALSRWSDWDMKPGEFESVIAPYRDATAAAFEGFVNGSHGLVDQWPGIQKKYQPVISFILDLSAYDEACRALPDGLPGEIVKLATPFNEQPFARVRFASYALSLWSHYEQAVDLEAANNISLVLARRLQQREP